MKKKFLSITHKSLGDFGVPSYKALWDAAKKGGYTGLAVSVKTQFTKSAEDKTFHAIFSTDSEDRHGDIVKQKPDLRMFKKNPVFLDSHNYDGIEHIIGRVTGVQSSEEDGLTEGDVQFFTDNPKGALAEKGVEQGFINATSIGFIPKVFDDKGQILEWELLEVSLVSVPAQAEALFGEKSADTDTKAEGDMCELEDGSEGVMDGEGKCVPKQAAKAEGDPCEMPDGTPGEMHPNGDGEMVCMPKKVEEAMAPKKRLRDIVGALAGREKAGLKMIAKAVDKMAREDRERNRRKLLQAIRKSIHELE